MSAVPTPSVKQHISRSPDVCGGKPCIAGTRIRVQDVYAWHELQGQSADQIVSRFPQLTHADVYAAMAYFWDNREALLEEIKRGDDFVDALKAGVPSKLPSTPRGRSDADPVSS